MLSPTPNLEPEVAALAMITDLLAWVALVNVNLRLEANVVLKVFLRNVGEVDDLRATLRVDWARPPNKGLVRVIGAASMIRF